MFCEIQFGIVFCLRRKSCTSIGARVCSCDIKYKHIIFRNFHIFFYKTKIKSSTQTYNWIITARILINLFWWKTRNSVWLQTRKFLPLYRTNAQCLSSGHSWPQMWSYSFHKRCLSGSFTLFCSLTIVDSWWWRCLFVYGVRDCRDICFIELWKSDATNSSRIIGGMSYDLQCSGRFRYVNYCFFKLHGTFIKHIFAISVFLKSYIFTLLS